MQPLLPFEQFRIPARHAEWFRMANAADYPERKGWFYPFKSRFLHSHAICDGTDLQTIVHKCWCGDGIFRGMDGTRPQRFWEACDRCNGTGIYDRKHVVLIRWLLNGQVYHEPTFDEFHRHRPGNVYKERFEGLIKHPGVDPRMGRRAMLRLLLRYEPQTYIQFWRRRGADWAYWRKVRFVFTFRRINQALRAKFGSPVEVEDVPW